VDLGASPGGWSQVASELAGGSGKVVAIDLARIKPLDGVTILRGDMRTPETVEAVIAALGGSKADCVISDMSPDISGNYSIDHARSIELSEAALDFARKVLRFKGNFVVKVFQGDMSDEFLGKVRAQFASCRAFRPEASRSQSSETYMIGKGFGMVKEAPSVKGGKGSEEE
jgi:23S rRNA (uridine2552-2'-O)-methyltransferase